MFLFYYLGFSNSLVYSALTTCKLKKNLLKLLDSSAESFNFMLFYFVILKKIFCCLLMIVSNRWRYTVFKIVVTFFYLHWLKFRIIIIWSTVFFFDKFSFSSIRGWDCIRKNNVVARVCISYLLAAKTERDTGVQGCQALVRAA